jgi:hypothetical protein
MLTSWVVGLGLVAIIGLCAFGLGLVTGHGQVSQARLVAGSWAVLVACGVVAVFLILVVVS